MALSEVRRRTRNMAGRTCAGENPVDDIRMEKKTAMFRELAEEYLERCDSH